MAAGAAQVRAPALLAEPLLSWVTTRGITRHPALQLPTCQEPPRSCSKGSLTSIIPIFITPIIMARLSAQGLFSKPSPGTQSTLQGTIQGGEGRFFFPSFRWAEVYLSPLPPMLWETVHNSFPIRKHLSRGARPTWWCQNGTSALRLQPIIPEVSNSIRI